MSTTVNPTFFVVALSARLTHDRLTGAREILEQTHRRDCHILDRDQIEGLFSDHLPILSRILHEGLSDTDARQVVEYFEVNASQRDVGSLECRAPARVLAGVPFRIALTFRSSLLATGKIRIWWQAIAGTADNESCGSVALIGPIAADSELGAQCAANSAAGDPLTAEISIELISYAVGKIDLGEVIVGRTRDLSGRLVRKVGLGTTQVVENVRPRLFERPFRSALITLYDEYERALARGVGSVAVTGAGGSGKSRLCEEFSLEKRRRGCEVLQAKQSKTFNDPHRLLADLLIGLAGPDLGFGSPADVVVRAISRYDRDLANRATAAIGGIVGPYDDTSANTGDQEVLPLPPVPYEACEKRTTRVTSLSLVRYRNNDYSVPTAYGHRDVLLKGYVHEVMICCGSEVIARHSRSYEHEDMIFDPLHYLALLEQKPNALDQAAPLVGWQLPEEFWELRRLLEGRLSKRSKREFVQVLRLLETFPADRSHLCRAAGHATPALSPSMPSSICCFVVSNGGPLTDARSASAIACPGGNGEIGELVFQRRADTNAIGHANEWYSHRGILAR